MQVLILLNFAFLQFLKKLNRQERVVEEVKLVLKPHYTKKHVTKEEYKDIMRKAVPKVNINLKFVELFKIVYIIIKLTIFFVF